LAAVYAATLWADRASLDAFSTSGGRNLLPKDCQPFVKTLQGNGYSTACFGKWHLTPDHMQGPGGPFDRWPNALGFDYFWGFLGGESGQFDPVIIENNKAIGVP
jgi:arylsulfatase A-like enzyme